MSADEFDPDIERLFTRSVQMSDSSGFAAQVEARLQSVSRVRSLVLMAAGLVGGIFAVRESLDLRLQLYSGEASTGVMGRGLQTAGGEATLAMSAIFDLVGLSSSAFGSMGGLQLFWLASAALVAMMAVGIVKLSEET